MTQNLYKIKSITHTGTRGKAGTPRHGGHSGQYYDSWTGMVVHYYDNGERAIMGYVLSNKGEPIDGYMCTSVIKDVLRFPNNDLQVTTENSIYYLEKVDESSLSLQANN